MVLILGGELSTDRKCKWVNKKFFEWIKPTLIPLNYIKWGDN